MNEYKHLTEMIPEMEPDKIFYKRIFLEYPAAHLDQAHTVEEIEKLCPEASSHAAAGFPPILETLWMKLFFLPMRIRSFSVITGMLLLFCIRTLFLR